MTTGLIIGKFLPPHRGHVFLIETALRQVERLTVLVCSLEREPIPGPQRVAWLREMFPGVDVRHNADENPQEPGDDPRFWEIWTASIRRLLPEGPDIVFTSEDYGDELARRLGARHMMVDLERRAFPVSGQGIRDDPMACWDYLPPCVRPHFVRRLVVTGPESTGKTTLAERLAGYFGTVFVPEFARAHLDAKYAGRPVPSPPCEEGDIPVIARGQMAAEDKAARDANRLLVCDTDLYATRLYAEEFFGRCPAWIREAAANRRADLHLLLDVDVPWTPDPQRDRPHRRVELCGRLREALEEDGRSYVVVSGSWEERWARAKDAAAALVAGTREPPSLSRGCSAGWHG
jgi:HTH-type transcriptional regulator, transcriptional repressor of NAD biosynthesis genes